MTELWLSYDTHTPVHPSLHCITDFLACIQLVSCLVVVPLSYLLLCVRKVLSEAQSAFSSASDEVAKAEAQIAIEVSQCPYPPLAAELWIQILLDSDPEFWPNLDPYPRLCYQFLKKKLKIILPKNNFLFNKKENYVAWNFFSHVDFLSCAFMNRVPVFVLLLTHNNTYRYFIVSVDLNLFLFLLFF